MASYRGAKPNKNSFKNGHLFKNQSAGCGSYVHGPLVECNPEVFAAALTPFMNSLGLLFYREFPRIALDSGLIRGFFVLLCPPILRGIQPIWRRGVLSFNITGVCYVSRYSPKT